VVWNVLSYEMLEVSFSLVMPVNASENYESMPVDSEEGCPRASAVFFDTPPPVSNHISNHRSASKQCFNC